MDTVAHNWSQTTNASNGVRVGRRVPLKLSLFILAVPAWDTSLRPQAIGRGVVRLEPNSGTTYRAEIAAGGSRNFSLVVKTNEFAQLTIDQKGLDLKASIYDPGNDPIEDDRG